MSFKEDWRILEQALAYESPLEHVARRALDDLRTYVDLGYEAPCTLQVEGVRVVLEYDGPRLVLRVGEDTYEPAAYRRINREGHAAQTRSVYLEDDLYEEVCKLGHPPDVMRQAIAEFVRRQRGED